MTAVCKLSPFHLSHDTASAQLSFLYLLACSASLCPLWSYAPSVRGLTSFPAACSKEAQDKFLLNKQANEFVGIMIVLILIPTKDKTRIWMQVVYLGGNFRKKQEGSGKMTQSKERNRGKDGFSCLLPLWATGTPTREHQEQRRRAVWPCTLHPEIKYVSTSQQST